MQGEKNVKVIFYLVGFMRYKEVKNVPTKKSSGKCFLFSLCATKEYYKFKGALRQSV